MATHADAVEHHRGDMNVQEQVHTYHQFLMAAKWGSLVLAVALIFLILWFCTSAGFWGGLVTAAVILAIGVTVLRDRSSRATH